MTEALFDQYGHPVNVLVDPDHPERLFDEYGRPVVVVKDATGLDLAAYNAIHVLSKRGVYVPFVLYNWWNATKVGSGDAWTLSNGWGLETYLTANSSAFMFENLAVSLGKHHLTFNFDLATILKFTVERMNSDSEAVAYFQFKDSDWDPVIEDISGKGFGIKIANYSLLGESYGTERGEVDLNTSLVDMQSAEIEIIHIPGTSIEWQVNGVSKGKQETPSKIPSGSTVYYLFTCPAIKNGATGGLNARLFVTNFSVWQSKT